jgi:hypothetical protein
MVITAVKAAAPEMKRIIGRVADEKFLEKDILAEAMRVVSRELPLSGRRWTDGKRGYGQSVDERKE